MGHKERTKKRRLARLQAHQTKDNPINDNSNETKRLEDNPKKPLVQPKKPHSNRATFPRLFSILSPTGTFFACITIVLTLVTAYYAFSVKLSISPSNPLDPSDPFSTPFVLRNESLLFVNLVNPYKCSLNHIKTENNIVINGIGTRLVKPSIPQLEDGESTTFMLPFNETIKIGRIAYADIEIDVSYYPAFFPYFKIFEKHYKKRFSTYRAKNENLQWEHKAKSEK